MLSSAYFLPIVYMAFFKEPEEMTHHGDHHGQHGEANLAMLIPLVITAVFSLILGVLPNAGGSFYDLAVMTAKSIVGGNLMGGGW
jgi:multicomponent Na+:H+ antiporter subunit D